MESMFVDYFHDEAADAIEMAANRCDIISLIQRIARLIMSLLSKMKPTLNKILTGQLILTRLGQKNSGQKLN